MLNEGATGTPNCDPKHAGFNAHWEPDFPNNDRHARLHDYGRANPDAIAADGYTVDRLYTRTTKT